MNIMSMFVVASDCEVKAEQKFTYTKVNMRPGQPVNTHSEYAVKLTSFRLYSGESRFVPTLL